MKKLFLILMGLLCLYFNGYTQEDPLGKQLSVSYNQTKLIDVLQDLEKKTGFKFSYSNDEVFLEKKISLSIEEKKLREILDKLFAPLQIEYHVINNKIILKPKTAAEKEKTISISGIVREKGSLESLPGATIYIPELKRGAVTNNYGFYSINLSPGDYTLEVSFVGYSKSIQPISGNQSKKMDIELEPSAALEEVVVNATRREKITETAQMSSVDIPINQIKDAPALLGEKDVFKVIQLFPGVQKGTEGSSGFYVRGGTPDQNLIILDDAVVYNANHLFGFFSVFNGDAIKNVQLIKGGFPARFGERLSSVLVVNMKDGNKEKLHGEVGVGLISSRFTLEGPIKKGKSSFLISGRRTYADVLAQPFLAKNKKAGYYFYDLNAKYHTEIDEKNRLYLSGYFGRDKLYFTDANDDNTNTFKTNLGWGNATLTARWNHIFNNKIFSNTSLIFSDYSLKMKLSDQTKTTNYSSIHNSSITDVGAKFDVDYTLGTQHFLRMGVRSVMHHFVPSALVTKGSSDYQNSSKSDRINSFENNLFIEDDWHINEKLALNAGLRASTYTTQGKTYMNAEPRISGKVMLVPELALKASYARMNQYTHLLSSTGIGLPTDLWIPSTKKISPQRSDQYALGLAKDLLDDKLTLSVEGYYKKMSHMVTYKDNATFLELDNSDTEGNANNQKRLDWENSITSGNGKSYGVEMLLQRKTGRLSGWIGYTLSWAKFQFADLNQGKEFYPKQDRRHDLSLVGIYEVSPKIKLSFSWVYSSGAPIILPVSNYDFQKHDPSAIGISTQQIQEYSKKNDFRTEAYHRLDIAAQFIKKKKYGERTWEIGFYNTYNRINPFYYDRSSNSGPNFGKQPQKLSKFGFPIIPSISYSYKF